MRLVVPVPSLEPKRLSLDQALKTYALERILSHHELLKVSLDTKPSEDVLQQVERQDAVLFIEWERHVSSDNWPFELSSRLRLPQIVFPSSPAVFLKEKPLQSRGSGILFCTSFSPAIIKSRRAHLKGLVRPLYGILSKEASVLWLAGSQDDLSLGAMPGNSTLICPEFPEIYVKAIVSSKAVFSFSAEAALIGLVHGVPSFMVCVDELGTRQAEEYSIPYVVWKPHDNVEKVAEAFHHTTGNYPWNGIMDSVENQRQRIADLVKHHSLLAPKLSKSNVTPLRPKRNPGPKPTEILRFSCIADEKYLPFFAGLVENLLNVHGPELEIHLLGVGDNAAKVAPSLFPGLKIHTYCLEDIWTKKEMEVLKGYPMGLRAVASKPRLLEHLLAVLGGKPLFFFDVDLYFFRSPVHLLNALGDSGVLLFPQWSDQFTWMRFHGMFNTGLIVVQAGGEPAMRWWAQQCLNGISYDISTGHYMDQACIELALLYFENLKIYKNLDENIAAWNRKTLGVHADPTRPWKLLLNGEVPVGSYHAAGPDDSGYFELKFAWDQIAAFSSPLFSSNPDSLEPFYCQTLEQQRKHWEILDQYLRERARFYSRLKLRLSKPIPAKVNQYLYGYRSYILKTYQRLYRFYRWLRSPWPQPLQPQSDLQKHWIESQREVLFARNCGGAKLKKAHRNALKNDQNMG